MSRQRPPRVAESRAGLLQISFAGVLWGTGGLAVQLIRRHDSLSPLTISAYRTAIAALVLLVAAVLLRRLPAVGRLLSRHPGRVVATGLLTALYQVLYFAAVVAVGVTVSTVVSLGIAPVLMVGVAVVRQRVRPPRAEVTTVVVALAGLVLVSAGSGAGTTGPHPLLGVLASLGSGSAYAAATVLGEPLARRTDPLSLTTAATTVGALGLVPVALIAASASGGRVLTGEPRSLILLGYLGAMTMALAYGLLYAGLRTTPGSAAVVATLLEPVTAAVAAALVLGERLGIAGLVGAVLILSAVASLARRPEVPAPVL